ncbi:hypothetical protein [Arsenicibacter rosenii]|uniref:Uncharacterized protein n=1 Tax=Arsenicibacter rosenii TaxID=1750698 RepID=A0A1S2VB01_9BACT|nr:hypothetical protein [Arsenicibacter rosenii]OIN55872.1 hypothetical protein BLX24_27850 [Arsenicibacter rosenii]
MANLKVKQLHFVVPVDVYGKDVGFFFGYNHRQIADILLKADSKSATQIREQILKETDEDYHGVTFRSDNAAILIAMHVVPETCREYSTLVHECFHAVEAIMENIGCSHDQAGNEPWAYLLSYLYEEATKKLAIYCP